MYFGFSNVPATFQSMINNILGDLICIRLVMVYLDDILIFGTCLKKHRWLVKEVLKRLQFNDLYAKAEKYFFEQSSIKYLGVIILKNKVQIDEEKCHDLAKWLSHYLFFFFFSFLFLLDLQLQDGAQESIMWLCHNVTMVWRMVTDGHSHSHSVSHD